MNVEKELRLADKQTTVCALGLALEDDKVIFIKGNNKETEKRKANDTRRGNDIDLVSQ